jgi:hypothetical protein
MAGDERPPGRFFVAATGGSQKSPHADENCERVILHP